MDLTLFFTEWGLDFWLPALIMAVVAYFCGCFNGAVIVSKYILRDDVRTHGSGNAGLTNFFRTFGGPLTLVVILTDVLKAVAAVLLTTVVFRSFLMNDPMVIVLAKYWGGVFCLLGHMFPCMFGFRGGKGILSGGTIALMMDWRIALVVWGGFLILFLLTRYVSLGSLWALSLIHILCCWITEKPTWTSFSPQPWSLQWTPSIFAQKIAKGCAPAAVPT